MNIHSEADAGYWLLVIIMIAGGIAIVLKPSSAPGGEKSNRTFWNWARSHYTAVIAGAMAYGTYVAADLLAGAAFPQFLREHLFDGFAPAALVGILVDLYPSENPVGAFPKIRRPIIVLLAIFISGAVIFGLIAAAAVFGSGVDDYRKPIATAAAVGGYAFSFNYIMLVNAARGPSGIEDYWSHKMWWFKKRNQGGTEPKTAEHVNSADSAPQAERPEER